MMMMIYALLILGVLTVTQVPTVLVAMLTPHGIRIATFAVILITLMVQTRLAQAVTLRKIATLRLYTMTSHVGDVRAVAERIVFRTALRTHTLVFHTLHLTSLISIRLLVQSLLLGGSSLVWPTLVLVLAVRFLKLVLVPMLLGPVHQVIHP
jgi:hypothetical protein